MVAVISGNDIYQPDLFRPTQPLNDPLKKRLAAVEKRMELKAVMRNKINQTRKIWIAAISLLLLAQITVRCQENTYVSGEVLTLDQAIALALRENHLVKNAELVVGKAEDEMAAARTFRFPSIHLYALAFLREEIERLPVASSDGSGRIVGVVSPLDVILTAIELVERSSSMAEAQDNVR